MANPLVIKGSVSSFIFDIKNRSDIVDMITQAGAMSLVEREYIRESPEGPSGDLRGKVKTEKTSEGFQTQTHATRKGKPYPLFLFRGTGKLKGARDYGFTPGRVQNDDVAFGIGGIRPNKFALRARDKAEKPVTNYVRTQVSQLIKKQTRL